MRDRVADIQRGWVELIERMIREAQAAGSIGADENPSQLAFELHAYLLMGNVGFILYGDAVHLERARAAIAARLSRAD